MTDDADTRDFGVLRDTGLLWLINASVFHPRGLALALVYADGDVEHESPLGWRLIYAGTGEAFFFGGDVDVDELFRAAEATMAEARHDG